MFNVHNILRSHLKDLVPYSSARDEFSGRASIYLDANENALGSTVSEAYNRYPDPYQHKVKEKLAAIKGVEPGQIFLGNGSDEAIDLLIRAFCEPKEDNIMIFPPTYGMYKVSAAINNIETVSVPLKPGFIIDENRVFDHIDPHTRLIFICNPNNPTGNSLDEGPVINLLEHFSGCVVVDEAYIDFAQHTSFIRYLEKYPNLVVMQTFSKAWGLAALRLGMAFAHVSIIDILNKIKPPYNISGLTQEKALEALSNESLKNRMVEAILKERTRLIDRLAGLTLVKHIYPTDTNFVLIKVDDPQGVYQYLLKESVVIRDRSTVHLCEGCLRITVGTGAENTTLIQKLAAYTG